MFLTLQVVARQRGGWKISGVGRSGESCRVVVQLQWDPCDTRFMTSLHLGLYQRQLQVECFNVAQQLAVNVSFDMRRILSILPRQVTLPGVV
ncbi:hypothetical protein PHMEG_00032658 [Phytophthora megakarya]|uniref:Uncharacterized protein n=1 Tax=Phytophthora megakarya TaxID=4795 RepID=A0A225UVE8_9STRA|nr:hypothetical protein PHMEG_00032658 [Phytophthora megakarya]